ncbi:MAG TPA: hypothetical protein VGT78_06595 [Rhizomicrobium sp.]|nr:hypothetical protein [Rhizomicrobium sp.]
MNMEIASKYRNRLLATVSSLALLGGAQCAIAGDTDRPPVWIELNWQFDRLDGMGDAYLPAFTDKLVQSGFKSPAAVENEFPYAYGAGGRISFEPSGSDWIFSASVRYGRSHNHRSTHEQTALGSKRHIELINSSGTHTGLLTLPHGTARFSDIQARNGESHTILDFQAGKDIGLGLFGSGSKSTVNFGLRFAQFKASRAVDIKADPDFYFPSKFAKYDKYHHTYSVTSRIERSFQGIGPSLSWTASVPILRDNGDDSDIALDFGINAAALFGRQKTRGHHQTTGVYYKSRFVLKYHYSKQIHRSGNPNRSRNVTVPNIGGFAGISFRYSDAKISFGYRGDFFFGAIDGGIDNRKSTTLGFNGPYASISVGLGD